MKYQIGQEVTLISVMLPNLNGNYKIKEAIEACGHISIRTGEKLDEPCYELEGIDGSWFEHSLSAKS